MLHNGGGDPFSFSEYELQSGAFPLSFKIELPRPGTLYLYGSSDHRFAGWACSNDKRYDDGMLVFDLAQPGETVTMTAVWE